MWLSPLDCVAREVACHFFVRAYCYTWAVGLLLHVPNLHFHVAMEGEEKTPARLIMASRRVC